ncbi:MAG: hypothetical protein IPH94_21845 [Saprospiraceae bacterium]|nr:hypothetical protein [Saprospiraceae bacterium]
MLPLTGAMIAVITVNNSQSYVTGNNLPSFFKNIPGQVRVVGLPYFAIVQRHCW